MNQLKAKFQDDLKLMSSDDYVTGVKVWTTKDSIVATLRLGMRESLNRNDGKLYFLLVNGSCIVFNKFNDMGDKVRNELSNMTLSNYDFSVSTHQKLLVLTPFGVTKVLYGTNVIDLDDVSGLIEVDIHIAYNTLNYNCMLIHDKNFDLLNTIQEYIYSESEVYDGLVNVDNFIDSYGSVKTYYDYDSSSGKIYLKPKDIENLIDLDEPTKELFKENQSEEESKLFTI